MHRVRKVKLLVFVGVSTVGSTGDRDEPLRKV